MQYLLKYKFILGGVLFGAIAGFAYYHFRGCASGTCPITSKPLNSAVYGALIGGLLFSNFKKKKSGNDKQKNSY
ncbi:MAG: hypothetical protein JST75_14335 [Bacteroidetes bacterium]|nr:hypothetical protein [Bacteroidota bacterium]